MGKETKPVKSPLLLYVMAKDSLVPELSHPPEVAVLQKALLKLETLVSALLFGKSQLEDYSSWECSLYGA